MLLPAKLEALIYSPAADNEVSRCEVTQRTMQDCSTPTGFLTRPRDTALAIKIS